MILAIQFPPMNHKPVLVHSHALLKCRFTICLTVEVNFRFAVFKNHLHCSHFNLAFYSFFILLNHPMLPLLPPQKLDSPEYIKHNVMFMFMHKAKAWLMSSVIDRLGLFESRIM